MPTYHCRTCRRNGLSTPEASRIFHAQRTGFDLDGCLSIVESFPAVIAFVVLLMCCGCFAWNRWH